MDRLDAMAILVASAEAGSFSAAGRKLGIPLPTVSRKIGDLEAHLKTRLFVRSTRKLVLTEAGVGYFAACRRILESIGEAEAQAAGEYSVPGPSDPHGANRVRAPARGAGGERISFAIRRNQRPYDAV